MMFGMDVLIDGRYVSLRPIALIILAVVLAVLLFRTRSLSRLLFAVVFGVYLLFAIDAVYFPIWMDIRGSISFQGMLRSINLVPFNYDFSFIPHMVWSEIFQNILLTVPFGFGVSFVARLKPRDFVWLVPMVGIGLEGTQLILALLGIGRSIDINDVFLNGLGVLIGYLLFRLFAWLYVRVTHRIGIPRSGLLGYVYDVAVRASGPPEERLPEPAAP
jgi:glycopeptide antibiotics resistance protein